MLNNGNMNGGDGFDPSMMMMLMMGNMNNMMQNMNMGGNNMNMGMQNMNMFGNNMGMQNMNMFGNNMGMQNMDMFGNNMNNMNTNNINMNKIPGKILVNFSTTKGVVTNMSFDYGTTMKNVFELYLKRVGRSDLIGNIDDQIYFIFNASKMNINDNRKIENVLYEGSKIIVNDVKDLIGA